MTPDEWHVSMHHASSPSEVYLMWESRISSLSCIWHSFWHHLTESFFKRISEHISSHIFRGWNMWLFDAFIHPISSIFWSHECLPRQPVLKPAWWGHVVVTDVKSEKDERSEMKNMQCVTGWVFWCHKSKMVGLFLLGRRAPSCLTGL